MNGTAIIIGAGPAGLTAAYELLTRAGIRPIVLERSQYMGGISRTINYKGNRMDIGGHRFFSKSDRVMNWWLKILPVDPGSAGNQDITLTYHTKTTSVKTDADETKSADYENVMLVRNRLSRIYYGRKFYAYPVRLDLNTIRN